MKIKLHSLAIMAAALLAVAAHPSPAPSAPPSQQPPAKVTGRAWSATASAQQADVIVAVAGNPDLSAARALATKEAKTRYVAETLLQHASRAQAALRKELDARKVRYQVLWINNSLFIPSADRATLLWLGARADVTRVDLDIQMRGVQDAPFSPMGVSANSLHAPSGLPSPHFGLPSPPDLAIRLEQERATDLSDEPLSRESANPESAIQNPQSIEWGVSTVRAPEVWALGITGQGIVVADLDTGVQWDHPALKGKYRGWNGSSANHNFNWFDAAYNQVGDIRSASPADDNSHGTHTVGTILGDDGAANQLGVAPGAQWIGCRNMRLGIGSVARYTLCFQFSLAPTDVNGNNPDPSKSADITSNSWSCDPGYGEQGCEVPSALVTVTQVLRDAGIMTVAAAGNNIFGCSGISHAPGTLDQAFTVGATDNANNIASFSNRGPSSFTGHLKPDLVAPGAGVRSSVPGSTYGSKSGTSMATPHVAGVVALLWSAAPWLRGQIDETEALLRQTARPLTTSETCGGLPAGAAPNNTYGHGLIDARAAVSEAFRLAITLTAQARPIQPAGTPVTYTIVVTNNTPFTHTNLSLTARIPVSTTLVNTAPPAVAQSGAVTWTYAQLAPSATLTATLVVSAAPGSHVLNTYALAANDLPYIYTGLPATMLVSAHRRWLIPVYR